MLYGGYYNLSGASSKAMSRASSTVNSRRPSEKAESINSQSEENFYQPTTTQRRSSLKKALDMFRVAEETVTPVDVYSTHATKRSGRFHRKEKKETNEPKKLKWNMTREQYELISAAA